LDIELDGGHIRVTISGGIAAFRRGETLEDFMHRADQYLYKAKEGGRNRNVSDT
jgi:PleD family two-component response regulator